VGMHLGLSEDYVSSVVSISGTSIDSSDIGYVSCISEHYILFPKYQLARSVSTMPSSG
jgi:hypothetical protein